MRTIEAFFIGVVLGGLLMLGWASTGDRKPQPIEDCACCEEFLDHIAQEHR